MGTFCAMFTFNLAFMRAATIEMCNCFYFYSWLGTQCQKGDENRTAEKGAEREGEREVDCGNFCRFATLAHVLAKLNTLQRELTTFSECVC